MPPKKKAAKKVESERSSTGAPVALEANADRINRHAGGVPVRVPDVPARSAGSDDGQSAGNEEN